MRPVTQMDFKLATADLGEGIFSVSVVGEIDLATAPDLKDALGEVLQSGASGVLVDLSKATAGLQAPVPPFSASRRAPSARLAAVSP